MLIVAPANFTYHQHVSIVKMTGFCVWCQDSAGWYLEQTSNEALRARLQPAIADGTVKAGTGLSNPVKALSGTPTGYLIDAMGGRGALDHTIKPLAGVPAAMTHDQTPIDEAANPSGQDHFAQCHRNPTPMRSSPTAWLSATASPSSPAG